MAAVIILVLNVLIVDFCESFIILRAMTLGANRGLAGLELVAQIPLQVHPVDAAVAVRALQGTGGISKAGMWFALPTYRLHAENQTPTGRNNDDPSITLPVNHFIPPVVHLISNAVKSVRSTCNPVVQKVYRPTCLIP